MRRFSEPRPFLRAINCEIERRAQRSTEIESPKTSYRGATYGSRHPPPDAAPSQNPRPPHDPLCHWPARLGTLSALGGRYRQGPHDPAGSAGERPTGPECQALPAAASPATAVLAAGETAHVALPGAPVDAATVAEIRVPPLSPGRGESRIAQNHSPAYVAPCVRVPPSGSWRRSPSAPTVARPSESPHYEPLSACQPPCAVHHSQSARHLTRGPCPRQAARTRPTLEVANIIRQYGGDYLARYGAVTSTAQRRVLAAGAQCHTAILGGHKRRVISVVTKRSAIIRVAIGTAPNVKGLPKPPG